MFSKIDSIHVDKGNYFIKGIAASLIQGLGGLLVLAQKWFWAVFNRYEADWRFVHVVDSVVPFENGQPKYEEVIINWLD